MLLRQPVLALEEEHAGKFEPYAHQVGSPYQHGMEGNFRFIKQRVPRRIRDVPSLCGTCRCKAEMKQRIGFNRPACGQWAEDRQRLFMFTGSDQFPCFGKTGSGQWCR